MEAARAFIQHCLDGSAGDLHSLYAGINALAMLTIQINLAKALPEIESLPRLILTQTRPTADPRDVQAGLEETRSPCRSLAPIDSLEHFHGFGSGPGRIPCRQTTSQFQSSARANHPPTARNLVIRSGVPT